MSMFEEAQEKLEKAHENQPRQREGLLPAEYTKNESAFCNASFNQHANRCLINILSNVRTLVSGQQPAGDIFGSPIAGKQKITWPINKFSKSSIPFSSGKPGTISYQIEEDNKLSQVTLNLKRCEYAVDYDGPYPSILHLRGLAIGLTFAASQKRAAFTLRRAPEFKLIIDFNESNFTNLSEHQNPLRRRLNGKNVKSLAINSTSTLNIESREIVNSIIFADFDTGEFSQKTREEVNRESVVFVKKPGDKREAHELNRDEAVQIVFYAPTEGSKYPQINFSFRAEYKKAHVSGSANCPYVLLAFLQGFQEGVHLAFNNSLA